MAVVISTGADDQNHCCSLAYDGGSLKEIPTLRQKVVIYTWCPFPKTISFSPINKHPRYRYSFTQCKTVAVGVSMPSRKGFQSAEILNNKPISLLEK